jgi:hypothetical protein
VMFFVRLYINFNVLHGIASLKCAFISYSFIIH